MRNNLPILNQEYSFPPGQTLVSTTDLHGNINYCNPVFIEVSGFTREELIGQPHNLIRHPDMPEEAFRDMWETIKGGRPWSAMVKNRRKDGSYYWVRANVTPLMEGTQPIGFMSVRTEPLRADIDAATTLYARMRAEKAQGQRVLRLYRGQLRVDTPVGRLKTALSLGLAGKLAMTAGILGLVGFGVGALAVSSLGAGIWLAALATAVVCALAGGFVLSGLSITPLHNLVSFSNRMAAGDLTQTLKGSGNDAMGELSGALNQLNVNLQSIVRDARTGVDNMSVATQEIAAGNDDLSNRTEDQASSLQQTAASMEQITGTVRQSAESAAQAAQLASQADTVTRRGGDAVLDVTRTMRQITESSNRIGEIIQVIDSIAFQTNILALNAAVEAARAGDQGRGFAVVASEVRALSQRTAAAAREVKSLIAESTSTVETGSRLADAAQITMTDALKAVSQVTALVTEISAASREQLDGIAQVNNAITQMDSITQQNAAMVEQIAAAANALHGQSEAVSESVRVFRLSASGSSSANTSRRPSTEPARPRLVADNTQPLRKEA
ncbi:methyl-accepting chemotaxis sensory transducer with Pas/Pac sensor [Rhodoferax sp. OV413]|uniref:methyl-accepting chemotaxis protein n=1 Tax=Rhodoferax sp. OV413 TaxID=1855285 RepID=UPI00088C9E01|nr:PAS domain-containing methyl-accepting chemotaxis protein [Rhodoferax sp. OV413]SDO95325.1 methyl-accepting chemotaxis sensory transducer with Pas/Pac sensor [Rhodoferax sp. OV413]